MIPAHLSLHVSFTLLFKNAANNIFRKICVFRLAICCYVAAFSFWFWIEHILANPVHNFFADRKDSLFTMFCMNDKYEMNDRVYSGDKCTYQAKINTIFTFMHFSWNLVTVKITKKYNTKNCLPCPAIFPHTCIPQIWKWPCLKNFQIATSPSPYLNLA